MITTLQILVPTLTLWQKLMSNLIKKISDMLYYSPVIVNTVNCENQGKKFSES